MAEGNLHAPTRIRKQFTNQANNTIWTQEEDEMLIRFVEQSQMVVSWSALSKFFPNKTASQLAGRWDKVLNPKLVKGSWTAQEDRVITDYVQAHGDKDWAKLALLLPGRTGKQCRERFKNHLDTSVNRQPWSDDEDNLLIELHTKFGNAWTKLATFFDGRTDNCVKNRWNSTIKKRLERMEKGEPLVMKRGRKPKVTIPVPSIKSDESSDYVHSPASCCSSPISHARHQSNFPVIELFGSANLNAIRNSHGFQEKPNLIQFPSLAQNRIDLQRMLRDLSVVTA